MSPLGNLVAGVPREINNLMGVAFSKFKPIPIDIDRIGSQTFTQLFQNRYFYQRSNQIFIQTYLDGDRAVVKIANNGTGVSETDFRVFQILCL